jgi:predicted phosphoribosyltransferase
MGLLSAQQRRVALPLGEHDHHQRGADADRLARRQASGVGDLPVGAGLAADLDLEMDVLAVVEQPLPAGPTAAVARKISSSASSIGMSAWKEELLRRALAQRSQDLLHALDRRSRTRMPWMLPKRRPRGSC